jgi:F-type H+-transporting ATPase subunit epsilon
MANTIHVDVVSIDEQIYSGEAEFVVLPGEVGELGIYPRHTPLITRIKPGMVRIRVPNQADEEHVFVAGGMLEVQPTSVTVLADHAIRAHDLDEAKAAEARRLAEEAMQQREGEVQYARAEAELEIQLAETSALIRTLRRRT